MIAFDIYQPGCVVIVRSSGPVVRLTQVQFRDLLKDRVTIIQARRRGALQSVHHVEFERREPEHRVERDCIGRDILHVGPRFLTRYWLSLPDARQDRCLHDVAGDLIHDELDADLAGRGMGRMMQMAGAELEIS